MVFHFQLFNVSIYFLFHYLIIHFLFRLGAVIAAEQTEDGMVESERHNRLRPYEVQLKKFSYQQVSLGVYCVCDCVHDCDSDCDCDVECACVIAI